MCSLTEENNEAQAQLCSITQRNTHGRVVAHPCPQEKLHNFGLIRYWIIQTLKPHFLSFLEVIYSLCHRVRKQKTLGQSTGIFISAKIVLMGASLLPKHTVPASFAVVLHI